jgi:NTP pyrophosphatase (non-canonical NTP hydrolase)
MKQILNEIIEFRNDRNWQESDTPSNLAKSIIIEAAELLENYQWSDLASDFENVKEELADILIYSLALSYDLGLDPELIIREKLVKNERKYPKIK